MKTQKEAIAWAKAQKGKGIDYDGYYGYQCMDLAAAYIMYVTDNKYRTWGNAIDAIRNSFGSYATIIKNTPSFVPKAGDVVVWTTGNFSTYGHIAIVLNGNPGGDLQTITVIEQNFLGGGASFTEMATVRTHDYTGITHFIRPNFKTETKTTTVKKESATVSKPTTTSKAKTDIKTSTKRIAYNMNNRGKKPTSVVIHNDAGSSSAQQYEKSLVNTSTSRYENGIAHSYASKGYVWEGISEDKVAWHTANQNGNTNAYGIEVCQSMSASDADFLKNEQVALKFIAAKMKKWGMKPNRNTVKLHMEYVSTACPHRSLKLHTGFDPVKSGRPSQATMNKLKDYFIKQIKAFMNGKEPFPTVNSSTNSSSSNAKPTTTDTTSGWKTNEYGTLYKSEKASFTCTVRQGIITRRTGPFVSLPQAGTLYYGQTVNYDTVCKQDGYVWISWTTSAGYDVWMPVRTWNKNTGKMGALWGTIS